jgi:hypothetical protein
MKPVTRRSFIATGSAGALGVAGVAALGSPISLAGADGAPELTDSEAAAADADNLMLTVQNARTGEVELLVAERSVKFTDKQLVARLLRASR